MLLISFQFLQFTVFKSMLYLNVILKVANIIKKCLQIEADIYINCQLAGYWSRLVPSSCSCSNLMMKSWTDCGKLIDHVSKHQRQYLNLSKLSWYPVEHFSKVIIEMNISIQGHPSQVIIEKNISMTGHHSDECLHPKPSLWSRAEVC